MVIFICTSTIRVKKKKSIIFNRTELCFKTELLKPQFNLNFFQKQSKMLFKKKDILARLKHKKTVRLKFRVFKITLKIVIGAR